MSTKAHHSERDRAALFDDIYLKIMGRDAFVPIKNERLNLNIRSAILSQRDSFIAADTDEKLFYALLRLNNCRKDVHVKLGLVAGGIHPKRIELTDLPVRSDRLPIKQAPIRFAVDYEKPDDYFFFVSDFSKDIRKFTNNVPTPGDRLIAVNGFPILDYFYMTEPYQRWSTVDGLWWIQSESLSRRSYEFSPNIYNSDVKYRLRRTDGEIFDITLPYIDDPSSIEWKGFWPVQGQDRYPGFEKRISRKCFDVYLPDSKYRVILLDWNAFDEKIIIQDIDYLLTWASENNFLDCGVIFDGTRASGGSYGPYVVQAISPRPFKTTFGNLRISDIIEPFIERIKDGRENGASLDDIDGGVWMDDGSWLWDWLINDVRDAVARKKDYSDNVPFKSTHLPKDSDGMLYPHKRHFEGKLACLFGPHGGSHLDQFASIVIDNNLGYTVGMRTAGYSNTWEWQELVCFPTTGKPVANMMWSMGHTIRPNGELLEGNPPDLDEIIPQTRDNYREYYDILLAKAMAYVTH